jgi:hypothetical protein
MTRTCLCCSQPFEPLRRDQSYCKRCGKNRNGLRKKQRVAHDLRFIGIDGEGITGPNGEHHYVLLSATGFPPLHCNGQRLTTAEIFHWLYHTVFAADPNAVYVGYFLGYDWSQIFRDLSEHAAHMLLTKDGVSRRQRTVRAGLPPFPVEWEGWQFDGLGLRRIRLRPMPQSKTVKVPWMYICDAGAFFQTSFLRAIDPNVYRVCKLEPPVSEGEYDLIKKGKAERGTQSFGEEMIRYNQAELQALPRIVQQLNEAFVRMGICLNRDQWFGPGQAAQAWLRKVGCSTGNEIRENIPEKFREAARRSYYGGWFEIYWHGPYPNTLWEYDINSAYPYVMATLPCLLHGRYRYGTGTPPSTGLVLIYAKLYGSDLRIGTMLHRRRDGQIMRPWQTRGWYWLHEIHAAKAAGLIDQIDIEGWCHYEPCDCPPPVGAIRDLYQQRVELGDTMKNSPYGVALKLVYNSCYGKFAQSIGNPKFANPVYASLITAGCRTRILEAIASHPLGTHGVAMVATDGVYFIAPHPTLELHKTRLGAWSVKERPGMTLFKPGVYWDDETRTKLATGEARLKSRGIDAKTLARHIDELDEQWAELSTGKRGWPKLEMPIDFALVSPKQALARGKWGLCGSVIRDATVMQSADPSVKRRMLRPAVGWSEPHMCEFDAGELVIDSTPYDGAMGEQLMPKLGIGVHPEGDIDDILRSILKGE